MEDRNWFRWHETNDAKLAPDRLGPVSAAVMGLEAGDLSPLATFLKLPISALPADIRLALVLAIEGTKDDFPGRLQLSRHPDLKPNEPDPLKLVERRIEEWTIAKYIEAEGGLEKGGHHAAIQAAATKFERSRSHIQKIWSLHLRSKMKGQMHLLNDAQIRLLAILNDV